MLLKDDKKRMVTLILRKLKGSDDYDRMKDYNDDKISEVPMKEGAEQDSSDALTALSQEAISALKSDDPKGFAMNLKEMIRLCMEEYDD